MFNILKGIIKKHKRIQNKWKKDTENDTKRRKSLEFGKKSLQIHKINDGFKEGC